jgi:hypothetical protein
MKSSETSQKYSCPGREQNQLIQVNVDVGVDDAEPRSMSYGWVVQERGGWREIYDIKEVVERERKRV